MPPPPRFRSFPPAFPGRVLLVGLCCLLTAALRLAAAEPLARAFDVPADLAEKTLRLFSAQSGCEVLFASDAARGVRTNAIKGEFSPREAVNRMLAGTAPQVRDERNGVFRLGLVEPRKNGPAAPAPGPANRDGNGKIAAHSRDPPSAAPAPKPPGQPPNSPTQHNDSPPVKNRTLFALLTGWLAAGSSAAIAQDTGTIEGRVFNAAPAEPPPVVLSPFEVVEDNRGYYAANTTAGTRLNSKIEDLGSAITVVTKQQMEDLAILDIHDLFKHVAGAEGAGTFSDVSIGNFGETIDNTFLNPATATRIRGVASANLSLGNYETSRRVPVDPLGIEAAELSRGPNASLFGIGSAGGTLNLVPATASPFRSRSQVQFRADSHGGRRASFDFNRVLRPNVLAVRVSAARQHDESVRKPSGAETERLNGMVKFYPFKSTMLSGSLSYYRMAGRRANLTTPLDAVSYWRSVGSPTWDPPTTTGTLNGVRTQYAGATLPGYFQSGAYTGTVSNSILFLDGGTVTHWTASRGTSGNGPDAGFQAQYHYSLTTPEPFRTGQPLFPSDYPITSKAIYDWGRINLAAMNFESNRTHTYKVQLEQVFLRSPGQQLVAQVGWFREASAWYRRQLYGYSAGTTNYLMVDINQRRLDGTPNPHFLQPFVGVASPRSTRNPLARDTYRGQLAYELDLRHRRSVVSWLGLQQATAYGEYKDWIARTFAYRDVMVSDHAWLPAGTVRANQTVPLSPVTSRSFYQYYLGDAVGQNVDHAPTDFPWGTYDYLWGNGATGRFVREGVTLGEAHSNDGTTGTRNVIRNYGAVLQSHLLGGRLISTLGWRSDESRTTTMLGARVASDGISPDYTYENQFSPGWRIQSGRTYTAGVVVRPLRWLSLHVNRSDSFQPVAPMQNVSGRLFNDPRGEGVDRGFSLGLFGGKLQLRVNNYNLKQIGARHAGTSSVAIRTAQQDFNPAFAWSLYPLALGWVRDQARAQGVTLSDDETMQRVAGIMKLPVEHVRNGVNPPASTAEVADITAKGTELELHCNPTQWLTVTASAAKTESIDNHIGDSLLRFLEVRLPAWQSIIDPTTGQRWWTTRYGNASPESYSNQATGILPPLKVALANEGKSRPQIRKYNFRLSGSCRMSGLTSHRLLRNFTIGTALRWEDKGAIGYYGVQSLPALVTDLDPNRPIYDRAHVYVDPWIRYNTRLFRDKTRLGIQLNVSDVFEGGRLQPVSALPDGAPNVYRIVDPRKAVLTVTFDL